MSEPHSLNLLIPDDSKFIIKPSELDALHTRTDQPLASCPNCLPSRPPFQSHNYVNILDFAYYGHTSWPVCSNGAMTSSWFPDIRYTLATPLSHQYPHFTKNVLSSERVRSTVREIATAEKTSVARIKKRALAIIDQMKAKVSKIVCKTIAYILFKVFRKIMSRILVCPAQMAQLKKAQESGIPLVYLPLHRSHLDYLLITWTVWHWGIQLPYVASADTMNVYGLGWVLRRTGAFFIRRRIGDEPNKGGEKLYRAVLNSYITEVLRHGMPLEFFLEGTRSRFGKTLLPRNGLMSNVVEVVQQGVVKDLFLIPVSFTYEQLVEDMFFEELLGEQKVKESVWSSVKGICQSIFFGRCGTIKIQFGVPVLLSDYLRSLKKVYVRSREQFHFHSNEATYFCRGVLPWQRGNPDSALIRAIGSHVLYDAQHQASISVCSAACTLLLCKYKYGGLLDLLIVDLVWFCDTLVTKGFDVLGWVKDETDGYHALQRTLSVIGTSIKIEEDHFFVNSSHVETLRLAYYKNAIIPATSITSAIALAIVSHRNSELASYSSVIETTLIICDLLQFEIIFCKPCENLRTKIIKEIAELSKDYLVLFQTEVLENNNVKIISDEAESTLEFYANIIKPFLYSLYLTTNYLFTLDMPFEGRDIDLIRAILAQTEKPEDSLALQALNSDSLNNSLKLIREKQLLIEGPGIGLSNVENARNFLSMLQYFVDDRK